MGARTCARIEIPRSSRCHRVSGWALRVFPPSFSRWMPDPNPQRAAGSWEPRTHRPAQRTRRGRRALGNPEPIAPHRITTVSRVFHEGCLKFNIRGRDYICFKRENNTITIDPKPIKTKGNITEWLSETPNQRQSSRWGFQTLSSFPLVVQSALSWLIPL